MKIHRGPHAVPLSPRALTVGNFDGVHRGHQAMLRRLVDTADRLQLPAAVMTFEPHPKEAIAPEAAPARLTSLREKIEAFAALGIQEVIVCRFSRRLASLSAEAFVQQVLVEKLGARHLLIGDDFRFGRQRAGDWALIERLSAPLGYSCEAMHSVAHQGERVSSTAVRQALAQGDLAHAERLLGRPYSISGMVVHGNKIGRTLGFPTANIQLQHNRPPLLGIYAVRVKGLADSPLPGAASLGFRPTIDDEHRATFEVHLLDFDQDIYGRHVHVDFVAKLRDEARYPNLEALKAQIALDVDNTRAVLAHRSESGLR